MSKKIKLSEKFKKFDFLKHYKNNKSKKYIYRCLACHYIQEGKSYDEVKSILHYSKPSVYEWIKNFDEGGIDFLLSIKKGRGKKPRLSPDLEEDFRKNVVKLQEERIGGRITGYDIMYMLKKQYSLKYSISGVYNLLSRVNISWVSSRSIHPEANEEIQEEFKKTSKTK